MADNATRDLSDWDYELLPIELGALKDAGYDLGVVGFEEDKLTEIMDRAALKEGLTDPDYVPEPPDEPRTPSAVKTLPKALERRRCLNVSKVESQAAIARRELEGTHVIGYRELRSQGAQAKKSAAYSLSAC